MKSAALSGKDLDYWMYRHACKVLEKTPTDSEFNDGHGQGKFQFSQDASLLQDLMTQYEIRVQFLADEWLASTTSNSVYGATPLEAACRLTVIIHFGAEVSK